MRKATSSLNEANVTLEALLSRPNKQVSEEFIRYFRSASIDSSLGDMPESILEEFQCIFNSSMEMLKIVPSAFNGSQLPGYRRKFYHFLLLKGRTC